METLERYFFEAAICKYPIGVAGLTRIRAIYVADNALAHMPPIERTRERLTRVLPLVDEFFAWVRTTARATLGRTLATKALGYAENQEQELRRVFLDGRLPLDNTRSERALRTIVVGRNYADLSVMRSGLANGDTRPTPTRRAYA